MTGKLQLKALRKDLQISYKIYRCCKKPIMQKCTELNELNLIIKLKYICQKVLIVFLNILMKRL